MADVIIRGELASRLESLARDRQVSVETLIASLIESALHSPALTDTDRDWLKAAEASFTFWDNDEDAAYDEL